MPDVKIYIFLQARQPSTTLSHFTQDSRSEEEKDQEKNEYEHYGGYAKRHEEFKYVWQPKNHDNPKDREAAHKAAKRQAKKKAWRKEEDRIPGAIAVLRDCRGNAISGLSIRGHGRHKKFDRKIGSHQREILDAVEKPSAGHKWCAEQPITHNVSVIRQRQRRSGVGKEQSLFVGKCFVKAYSRGWEHSYKQRKPACGTCQVTNKKYVFEEDSSDSLTTVSSKSEQNLSSTV